MSNGVPQDPRVRELLKRRGVDVESATAGAPEIRDEPADAAEVEARREKLRAAKAAMPVRGRKDDQVLSPETLDAVLPRTSRADPPPAKCPDCGGRINTFNGLCPRCKQAPPATALDAVVPGKPCPTCGRPRTASNWCYTCRPGGPRAGVTRVAAAAPAAAPRPVPVDPGPAPGVPPVPRPVPATPDPELAAMAAVLDALSRLDAVQRGRVLGYLRARLGE